MALFRPNLCEFLNPKSCLNRVFVQTLSRRAAIIFNDVLPHAKICVVSNPYEQFTGKWWTDRSVATKVVLETVKTIFYKLGGAFRSTDTPSQALVAPSSQ